MNEMVHFKDGVDNQSRLLNLTILLFVKHLKSNDSPLDETGLKVA